MHLIFGLSRNPRRSTSIFLTTGVYLTITPSLLWFRCFSVWVEVDIASSVSWMSMKDTILDWSLFFGALTTMMNSWDIWGPIFKVMVFWSSLETGFSMNQQLNSISEFLIVDPSLYWKGSSSLLYWPKIESHLNYFSFEMLIVTTWSLSEMLLSWRVDPRILPQMN